DVHVYAGTWRDTSALRGSGGEDPAGAVDGKATRAVGEHDVGSADNVDIGHVIAARLRVVVGQ
ncbi:MAG: hypothetical protein GY888_20285, partial [Planctomycetaceae bacterium]|nr:hypothetical protein [Planctomycetaceae bacterium]